MTDWTKLADHFPADEVKRRPGAATYSHREECQKQRCRETSDPAKHHQFDYVDARAVAQRLDDVLTPAGWTFTWTNLPGTDIVHGRLDIGGVIREDAGYPNSERDEEPIKAAVSDALKRCAVLFGIGRHLYEDNKTPAARRTPAAARPAPVRAETPPRPHLVDTDVVPPEPEELDALFAEPTVRADLVNCPIHDVPWAGTPGDLYHRKGEGGFCRHPDNLRKERAR